MRDFALEMGVKRKKYIIWIKGNGAISSVKTVLHSLSYVSQEHVPQVFLWLSGRALR